MANADRRSDTGFSPHQHVQPSGPLDRRSTAGALDLNRASEQELAEIDMIGKKLAHQIVEARTQRGGFQHWEELQEVPGLDPQRIAELQRATRLARPAE